ncbi:MAG TPA: nitrate- and nitrite sensing domain-containing protein, partial [Gallionella sp.]|nr:nitrate- and nitrite sensing domain-containing protein [Gallionella sp.]
MRPLSMPARMSIRTVLLAVLVVLGGWGLIASWLQIDDSWRDYRENRALAERGRVAAHLLTAGQQLSYERGRTAAMLRAAGPTAERDRALVGERRRFADAALDAAAANINALPQSVSAELDERRREIGRLRQQVDRAAALPLASRDSRLAERWFDNASRYIDSIQGAVERLIGENRPGDRSTRLTLLAAAMLQMRMTADGEASGIAQALTAGKLPAAETLYAIHAMRGREEQLWHDVERLATAARIDAVRKQVEELRERHIAVVRPLQDRALAELAARGPVSMPLEELTAASLPVLDGMSDLMILALGQAVRLGDEDARAARTHLIAHSAWCVALLLLLTLSLRYVLRHVVAPLEQVDRELRSIGALPADNSTGGKSTGNEIERLKATAVALQKSLVLLAEAQRIAHVGSWEYDIVNDAHKWSDELFRIFEIDPESEGATYEGCISATHPDDREAVARAYL